MESIPDKDQLDKGCPLRVKIQKKIKQLNCTDKIKIDIKIQQFKNKSHTLHEPALRIDQSRYTLIDYKDMDGKRQERKIN